MNFVIVFEEIRAVKVSSFGSSETIRIYELVPTSTSRSWSFQEDSPAGIELNKDIKPPFRGGILPNFLSGCVGYYLNQALVSIDGC